MDQFTVIFRPHNKTIRVPRGTDLLDAAYKAGITLASSCGGEGLCGKCKVIVNTGTVRREPSKILSDKEKKEGLVLACESLVESDLEVTVPAGSLEFIVKKDKEFAVPEEFPKGLTLKEELRFKHAPLVRKVYLELPRPSTDDNVSDLDRIYRELSRKVDGMTMATRLANVKQIASVLRESDFKVTAVIAHKECGLEILSIEPGDTTNSNFGFAFDIGTTTVTGQLIDLNSGQVCHTRIAYNRQASFGADVITRIIYGSSPEGLERLNEAVLANINEMADDLAASNGTRLGDIFACVSAGNTTMMHLLLKVDPSHIRREPYIPAITAIPFVNASEAGIKINPKGIIYCLSGVSAYIGGDVVAGVLSSGQFEDEALSLLVDIGTNGEIVLGSRDWMMACSASAGPAFEGSGVGFGMKAVAGAIQKAAIDDKYEVSFETIGGAKPKGICGSGYIDILRGLLKARIIEKDGRIDASLATKRIRKTDSGHEFVVAFKNDTAIEKDITISGEDIENLKRSKAAIYSAIMALTGKVGKTLADVKRIYIAGGFGNYLDIESAIYIGLLPDIDRNIYEFVGNSSLAGARLSLASEDALKKTNDIYKKITYLDLGSEAGYMDEYIAALFFPHTDLRRFPSIRS